MATESPNVSNSLKKGAEFPTADVDKELNPGHNKSFEVDSASLEIAASTENKNKGQPETNKTAKDREKKDSLQNLKTAIMVSAVVVAVAGAAFAITKKLREK